MAERHGRRQEAVRLGGGILRQAGGGRRSAEEHARVAHAEIAFQIMDFPQIEIDEPRTVRELVVVVLRVVAVRQTAVEAEVAAFGIDGAFPRLFLQQHDFAEGVEDLRERPATGHTPIIVATAPRRYACMDIAVRRAEMEFLLDDRRQFLAVFDAPQRFRRVAAGPRGTELVVRRARHHVHAPIFVHRREIREVVVRPVDESKRVLHVARIVVEPLVAAFFRGGQRPERVAFAAVAPAVFMVANEAVAQAVPPERIPVFFVRLAVARRVASP